MPHLLLALRLLNCCQCCSLLRNLGLCCIQLSLQAAALLAQLLHLSLTGDQLVRQQQQLFAVCLPHKSQHK